MTHCTAPINLGAFVRTDTGNLQYERRSFIPFLLFFGQNCDDTALDAVAGGYGANCYPKRPFGFFLSGKMRCSLRLTFS